MCDNNATHHFLAHQAIVGDLCGDVNNNKKDSVSKAGRDPTLLTNHLRPKAVISAASGEH